MTDTITATTDDDDDTKKDTFCWPLPRSRKVVTYVHVYAVLPRDGWVYLLSRQFSTFALFRLYEVVAGADVRVIYVEICKIQCKPPLLRQTANVSLSLKVYFTLFFASFSSSLPRHLPHSQLTFWALAVGIRALRSSEHCIGRLMNMWGLEEAQEIWPLCDRSRAVGTIVLQMFVIPKPRLNANCSHQDCREFEEKVSIHFWD